MRQSFAAHGVTAPFKKSETNGMRKSLFAIRQQSAVMYDTEEWEDAYLDWIEGEGPEPPQHPDPDCVWNQDKSKFDLVEYYKMVNERKKVNKAQKKRESKVDRN